MTQFLETAGGAFVNVAHIERLVMNGRRDNPQRVVLHMFSGEQATVVIHHSELAKLIGEERLTHAGKTASAAQPKVRKAKAA